MNTTPDTKTHLLFSVAGASPAVITETLYGLRGRGIEGGKVQILTTNYGYRCMQPLFGDDGQVAAFNRAYDCQWEIDEQSIEVISRMVRDTWTGQTRPQRLEDLRNEDDNKIAANRIVERVRELTDDLSIILLASLAGGRKTMGFYLAQAMSWFARPGDKLTHVLVPERCENDRDFYFPVPGADPDENLVDLSSIPFVRMRDLMPAQLKVDRTYSELVDMSQTLLNDSLGLRRARVTIETRGRNKTLRITGGDSLSMGPMGMGLYIFLYCCANEARGQEPFRFDRAIKFRAELSEVLSRLMDPERERVSQLENTRGLSGLAAVYSSEGAMEWPEVWRDEGGKKARQARESQLNSGFGKLTARLKSIPDSASFAVHYADGAKSGGRGVFVNLDPENVSFSDPQLKEALEAMNSSAGVVKG